MHTLPNTIKSSPSVLFLFHNFQKFSALIPTATHKFYNACRGRFTVVKMTTQFQTNFFKSKLCFQGSSYCANTCVHPSSPSQPVLTHCTPALSALTPAWSHSTLQWEAHPTMRNAPCLPGTLRLAERTTLGWESTMLPQEMSGNATIPAVWSPEVIKVS